ncbi:MAG: TetR/AcrR family transcriptional regulator [Gemmatimonadota bacterium]
MKEPKQRRSQRTLERLRQAGLRLIDETGPDGLTVQQVAKEARSSVGSFYQRFQGKDEFLVDLWSYENQAAVAEWERRVAGVEVDSEDLVCRLSDLLKTAELERGTRLRHLRDYLDRERLLPGEPPLADRLSDLVRSALQARAAGLGATDPERTARIVAACLFLTVEAATEGRAPYAALLSGIECTHLDALLHPAAQAAVTKPRTSVDPFDVWDDGSDVDERPDTLSAGA